MTWDFYKNRVTSSWEPKAPYTEYWIHNMNPVKHYYVTPHYNLQRAGKGRPDLEPVFNTVFMIWVKEATHSLVTRLIYFLPGINTQGTEYCRWELLCNLSIWTSVNREKEGEVTKELTAVCLCLLKGLAGQVAHSSLLEDLVFKTRE